MATPRSALSLSARLSQVMYFSSVFPYVVLFCFLVRGLLLKGAMDGIAHMFTPKVSGKETEPGPNHAQWKTKKQETKERDRLMDLKQQVMTWP